MAQQSTLLDLVTIVSKQVATEAELLATVVFLVNSGAVRLCGTFRDSRFDIGVLDPRCEEAP
jgi:hypothetical protein